MQVASVVFCISLLRTVSKENVVIMRIAGPKRIIIQSVTILLPPFLFKYIFKSCSRLASSDLPGSGAGAADPSAGHPLHPQRGRLPLDGPDEAAAGEELQHPFFAHQSLQLLLLPSSSCLLLSCVLEIRRWI